MKIRKYLSLVLIFTLTAPVYGLDLTLDADLIDTNINLFSPSAFYVKPVGRSQGCKASRSQSRLLNFFDNKPCQEAGNSIFGADVSKPMCENVYACTERNELPVAPEEQSFLKTEFMMYVISENVQDELIKYQSPESNNLRVLNSYVDKLPSKFKEKVRSCPAFKLSSPKCLNEDQFDLLAKISIKNYYGQNQAQNFVNYSRRSASIQAAEENDTEKPAEKHQPVPGFASDFGLKKNVAFHRTPTISFSEEGQVDGAIQLMQNVKFGKDVTPEEHYISILKTEKEWSKTGRSEMKFDPSEDILVNEIVKSTRITEGTPTDAEMKSRIKKAILQFAIRKEDPYISFDKDSLESLEKQIDKMSITLKDITDSNRSNLSAKVNDLRVKMVNEVFARECQDKVVSIGQLCQFVSTNVKEAKVQGENVQTKDLFKKMIYSYNKRGKLSENFEKVQTLERMIKAKDQVYDRFVAVMFNLNSCKEKFPSTYAATAEEKKAFENLAKKEDANASANLNEAARNIAEVVTKDVDLKNVFRNRGVDVEAFKFENKPALSNLEFSSAVMAKDGQKTTPGFDKIENELKSFAETAPQNTNPNLVNQVQNPNYNFMNNVMPVENAAPVQVNHPGTDALEEKIKSLEKKESKLRKKVAVSDAEDESESDESSELASLRKQIEDLKKEKDRVVAGPAAVQDSAEKNGTPSGRGPVSAEQSATIKVAGEKAAIESGPRIEEVAAARSNSVSQNADYGAEAQAAIGSARGPASTGGASNAAGKGGGDKAAGALVLSKNGESVVDSSTILENPNEGDIASTMEKTKGEPFIIRENGELIKIAPILDAKGKPVLTSLGKIKFKKIKLTKAQQEIIAKETNVNKAAKEVGVEPTRLYKLKSLLKEVRRE